MNMFPVFHIHWPYGSS